MENSYSKRFEDIIQGIQYATDKYSTDIYTLRHVLYKIISDFTLGNNPNELEKNYKEFQTVLLSLKKLENYLKSLSNNNEFSTNTPLANNILNEFQKYCESNYNEYIQKNLPELELNYKFPLVSYLFISLFELGEDGIIKDFIKNDNQIQLQSELRFEKNIPPHYTLENIYKQELTNFLEYNKGITITELSNITEKYIYLKVKVENTFKIFLKIKQDFHQSIPSNNNQRPRKYQPTIGLGGIKERFDLTPCFCYNKNFFFQHTGDASVKSNFHLFRKLTFLLEDRLNILLKNRINENRQLIHAIFLFLRFIAGYKNLFQKTCEYCQRVVKYNPYEKAFYPPYLRYFNLEKQLFYHEDCFAIINNQSA